MQSSNRLIVRLLSVYGIALGFLLTVLPSGCAGRKDPGGSGGVAGFGGGTGGAAGWSGYDGSYTPQQNPDARPLRCNDAGEDCKCMAIASMGQLAAYGSGADNTLAFQEYLNTRSSARVELVSARTTITADFLANYDILILQALEDGVQSQTAWTYSPEEIAALEAWVREGNAVIAMSGYGPYAAEIQPTNQLLAFSGISYNATDTFVACPDGLCYCVANSIPFSGWTPGGPLAFSMVAPKDKVGLFHGRGLSCTDTADGPCEVMAEDAAAGIVGVGKQVGKGRVFAWADEWVTYTSQWADGASTPADSTNPYNPCYQKTVGFVFNLPQFWYNTIHWSLPDASCFRIDDAVVVE